MSQYNENDPNRPLEGTPQEPLSGGPVPPPPIAEAGANPPPPPLFSQEPAPDTIAGSVPPPPPGGTAAPQYGSGPYGNTPAGTLTAPTPEERNWAMFAHLSSLAIGLFVSWAHFPILCAIGPLIIYLIKKDQSPYIADQAKEALNFSITVGAAVTIIMWIALILIWTFIIPMLLYPIAGIVGLAGLVFMVIAAVKASEGQLYRYPFNLRLVN